MIWSGAHARAMLVGRRGSYGIIVAPQEAPSASTPLALLSAVDDLMMTAANAPHPANACSLMVVVEVEIVTLAKELHPSKEPSSMLVTHRRRNDNACYRTAPMASTNQCGVGMSTLANEMHPWKTFASMLVTNAGMATLLNDLHRWRAHGPMLVTDFGIVTLVTPPLVHPPFSPRVMSFPIPIWLSDAGSAFRNGKVHAATRWCCCCRGHYFLAGIWITSEGACLSLLYL